MKLRELGEDRFLRQLLPRLWRNGRVLAGAGEDDCAVVQVGKNVPLLLLKTDCVVAGIHFGAEAKPRAVGWKAMARALSDVAAMAGRPRHALVTLLVPPETEAGWVRELYRGLDKAARAYAVPIVGGETSRTTGPLAVSVCLTGEVEANRWTSRSGGKAGDLLYVTGRLGGSLRGRHLRFEPRIEEARWLAEHFRPRAMMDLSDGLGADLPRLARASGVGFRLEKAAIPCARGSSVAEAISDGEDYELLFALAPGKRANLEKRWKRKYPRLPLTCIGQFTTRAAAADTPLPAGYDHFQER